MKRKKDERDERNELSFNKLVARNLKQVSKNTAPLSDIKLRQLIMFDNGATMSVRPTLLGDISLNSRVGLSDMTYKALNNLEVMIKDYDFIRHSLSPSDMVDLTLDTSDKSRYSWSYCKRKIQSSIGERPLDEFIEADGIASTEYTTMHEIEFDKFEFCRLLLSLVCKSLSDVNQQIDGSNALITLPKDLQPFSWLIHYHLAAMFGNNVSIQTILDSEYRGLLYSDICINYSSTCDKSEIADELINSVDGLLRPGYCMIPDQRSVVTSSAYHVTSFLVVPDQSRRVRLLVTLNGSTLISVGK